MPSTTDKKISSQGLLGPASTSLFSARGKSPVGGNARLISENQKAIKINAKKITVLKNISQSQSKRISGDTVGEKLPGGGGLRAILGEIASSMDGIKQILIDQNELDKEAADDQRKADEKDKRSLKEKAIEGIKGTLKAAGQKMLKPFVSLWDTIMDFIKLIFFGRIGIKLWEWFSDPANTQKISSIFRFIKDWWPVIVAGIMAFVSPGLTAIVGTVALLTWATVKIIDAVKSVFGFGPKIDKALEEADKESDKDVKGVTKDISKKLDKVAEEGQQDKPQVKQPDTSGPQPNKLAKGGEVPGKGDKDTVPAMLTPGEFVMSKDAVKQWGIGTLAGMNAAGGGSNSATMNGEGVMGFNGGGFVPGSDIHPSWYEEVPAEKPQGLMRGLAGAADWMTGGIFDFDKRGGGLSGMFGGGVDGMAKDMIKVHEGLRLEKYLDSEGFPTIGYGHLVLPEENIPDKITKEKADKLFDVDYKHHKNAATKIPGYKKANKEQKAALIDLTFNMGPAWYKGFPKFTAAFKEGDYDEAGRQLEDSKWYGQVQRRGPTIVSMIKGDGVPEGSYLKGGGGAANIAPSGGSAETTNRSSSVGSGGGSTAASSAKIAASKPPSPTVKPPVKRSATLAYLQEQDKESQPDTSMSVASSQIPLFDPSVMISQDKIRTLGITL